MAARRDAFIIRMQSHHRREHEHETGPVQLVRSNYALLNGQKERLASHPPLGSATGHIINGQQVRPLFLDLWVRTAMKRERGSGGGASGSARIILFA